MKIDLKAYGKILKTLRGRAKCFEVTQHTTHDALTLEQTSLNILSNIKGKVKKLYN